MERTVASSYYSIVFHLFLFRLQIVGHVKSNKWLNMVRMAGSKLLARLLLLISSLTLVSLLALTRCGLGGLVDNNILITDDGMYMYSVHSTHTQDCRENRFSFTDSTKLSLDGVLQPQAQQDDIDREQQTNYMILMQQREEENRQEIAKLTAEIKSLKVQLLQHRSECGRTGCVEMASYSSSSLHFHYFR